VSKIPEELDHQSVAVAAFQIYLSVVVQATHPTVSDVEQRRRGGTVQGEIRKLASARR
jgi:hypothetical protein